MKFKRSHEDHYRQIEAVPKEDLKNVYERYESLPSVFHHVSKILQASPVPGRSRESLQPVPAAMAAAVVAVLEPNAPPLFAVRTNLRARGRVNGSKFSHVLTGT